MLVMHQNITAARLYSAALQFTAHSKHACSCAKAYLSNLSTISNYVAFCGSSSSITVILWALQQTSSVGKEGEGQVEGWVGMKQASMRS